jgi:type IV pilus assembly protein PilY1
MSLRTNLNCRLRMLVLVAAVLTLPSIASGEDIDLYTGTPINGGQPNVILLLDSSNSWNGDVPFNCPTAGVVAANNVSKDAGFEQCSLYSAITTVGTNPQLAGNINVGLMRWDRNKDGTTNAGTSYSAKGGYFKFPQPQPALLPVIGDASGSTTSTGATNLSTLQAIIKGIDRTADGSSSPNTGGGMQEVWAYYSRHIGMSTTNYSTLAKLNACQKNFVIYIANAMGNGDPNMNKNDWGPALVSAGATAAQQQTVIIPPPYTKYQGDGGGPEWARFMYQTDLSGGTNSGAPQNIITYTIAVTDGKNPDYVSYVQSMASNGGGKSFVINVNDPNALNDLVKDLTAIFDEVQATNSVFASVSLPVSVNAQGTSLNQVYVGMFRPDATAAPRWAGNLKQYQLGYDTSGNVVLNDSLGKPAISNAQTGFIAPTALSFWTADNQTDTPRKGPFTITAAGYTSTIVANWPTSGFWVNHPTSAGGAFDAPDGEIVDKGGVAEMARADYLTGQTTRKIYTCTSVGSCPSASTLPTFDATTLAGNTLFGTTSSSTPSTSQLIDWIRGTDNNTGTGAESPAGPGGLVTVRPSIHGDVLHSRPAVVNYGGSIGIVVFYGSNDGLFRAVNGNKDATAPGVITMADGTYVRPGGELWSFIAPDFFGRFKRLRSNSPALTLGAAKGSGKDYFFDGTTTVYQDLRVAGSPKTYIYLTARRGGRLIYAFDVSDPTKPPVFLWSKTNADIPELGQTWSQPKLALVKGHKDVGGNPIPVVIMGGGYDTAEDTDPATTDTMGRAIVVLDAVNGSTVWTACASGCTTTVSTMTYAIPSDITLLDRDGDGYTDRLYAGDLGGNLWRADINDASTANWTVTRIASLRGTGKGTGTACAANPTGARKFFYPPDVTPTTAFDAVVAASGDREHPLLANASSCVVNRFYMLKDTNTGTSVASGWTTITESMLTDESGAAAGTTSPYSSSDTTPGFYITLNHSGEKAVNAPLTVAGYTYFGTNTPADPTLNPNMCYPNLGIARGYAINFLTGTGLNSNGYIVFDGGGLPPSPVFGLVAIDPSTPNVYTPVLIGGGNQTGAGGGNGSSALGAQQVTPPNTGKRKRTYWFTEGLK